LSKRLIAMLAAVLAVAVVAAGCGGSDDSSSATTETAAALSKAEFIKQADAICTKGNESIETEANEFAEENNVNTKKPKRAQQEEVIIDVVAPGVRRQGEEIAELGAPSGDEEEIDAIVAAVEEGADELEEDPGLLISGKNPLAKGSKMADSYGLKVCGEE
jgi:ABC-type glycerol-3-phosphate transport system substrate-binding protein